jgi:hypothetical protein
MLRQVDSSLLDEWEKMRDPSFQRAETKEVRPPGAEEAAQDITRDTKAFTAAIRNRIFVFLRGLVIGDYEAALESLDSPLTPALSPSAGERENRPRPQSEPAADDSRTTVEESGDERRLFPLPRRGGGGQGEGERTVEECKDQPWSAARLQQAMDAYHAEHEQLLLTPEARNARHTYVLPSEDKKTWRVQQMLVDPEGDNDWVAEFEVDLVQSRATGEPFLELRRIGSLV